jgi:hypothetical protein
VLAETLQNIVVNGTETAAAVTAGQARMSELAQ